MNVAPPVLNQNQPKNNKAAPIETNGNECGADNSWFIIVLFLRTRTDATAAAPQVMWITTPPAQSSAPPLASHPPPQIQWQTGI